MDAALVFPARTPLRCGTPAGARVAGDPRCGVCFRAWLADADREAVERAAPRPLRPGARLLGDARCADLTRSARKIAAAERAQLDAARRTAEDAWRRALLGTAGTEGGASADARRDALEAVRRQEGALERAQRRLRRVTRLSVLPYAFPRAGIPPLLRHMNDFYRSQRFEPGVLDRAIRGHVKHGNPGAAVLLTACLVWKGHGARGAVEARADELLAVARLAGWSPPPPGPRVAPRKL